MTRLWHSLTQMYALPKPAVMRARAIQAAEAELITAQADLRHAEASAEYWQANAAMLRRRVKRLQAQGE